MKSLIMITGVLVILILTYSCISLEASSLSHNYIPLSSVHVQGAVNVDSGTLNKENALLSLNFTLSADTNGIFPTQEDVILGFLTPGTALSRKQCIIFYIPAYSFEGLKRSYEIYENTDPSHAGIKVLVVDEHTGEILKDFSHSLSFFNSIIMQKTEEAQYNLIIDALFSRENSDVPLLDLIASSSKSVLIVGDDSGSALAKNMYFRND